MTAVFLIALSVVGAWAIGLFVLSLILKDQSIMDIAYGLIFVDIAFTAAYLLKAWSPAVVIGLVLVSLWGARLSFRIYRKNRGKPEDFRYQNWRMVWNAKGRGYFLVRSFLQVFTLQGVVILLVSMPLWLLIGMNPGNIEPLARLGILVWIVGFVFESVADFQLDRFLKDPANKGKIMDRGLFRYSRRPNYFGESLMWWGLALFASPMLPFPYGIVVFISPILITYIVTLVTGPMLEAKWADNPQYQAYRARTSYFIPLPVRRV